MYEVVTAASVEHLMPGTLIETFSHRGHELLVPNGDFCTSQSKQTIVTGNSRARVELRRQVKS
jgi:hypothetical protein